MHESADDQADRARREPSDTEQPIQQQGRDRSKALPDEPERR